MMRGSRVCLDTSVVIARFLGSPGLDAPFETAWLHLPCVVLGELYYGAFKSRFPEHGLEEIRKFMLRCDVLPDTPGIARRFGEIKADLSSCGSMIPDNDIWIAATAIEYDLPLAARDAHFDRVPGLGIVRW